MAPSSIAQNIEEAAAYIRSFAPHQPQVGLILGSGLGVLAEAMEHAVTIEYADIPHFPVSTVEGHAGQLLIGDIGGTLALLMKGRFHPYEGYAMEMVAFPVRVMKALGIHTLLVTNAAGGVNEGYSAGDLMVISDHLNLMGRNPLIGPNDHELGPRFPDMSTAYDSRLRQLAHATAAELGVKLREGVYAGLLGPNYETPAEIRMLRLLGADAVGMSTVPEVIAARHAGIEVLGLSCITNMAAGMAGPLSHAEVMETADRVRAMFLKLVSSLVPQLSQPSKGEQPR